MTELDKAKLVARRLDGYPTEEALARLRETGYVCIVTRRRRPQKEASDA